jgi:putative transposase
MPRAARIDLPGIPQHLISRGHNRATCFFRDQDRRIYLRYLSEAAAANECDIHAFTLMGNHVHLLATGRSGGAISRMMHVLGTRYARHVNEARDRSGSLYEGRFKSSPIESSRYFLTCMRYIELNAVRAGMVARPEDYAWSSFPQNAIGDPFGWLCPHAEYLGLGKNAVERRTAYRDLFARPFDDRDLAAIRAHIQKSRALGSEAFRSALGAALRREVGIVPVGRPRKM